MAVKLFFLLHWINLQVFIFFLFGCWAVPTSSCSVVELSPLLSIIYFSLLTHLICCFFHEASLHNLSTLQSELHVWHSRCFRSNRYNALYCNSVSTCLNHWKTEYKLLNRKNCILLVFVSQAPNIVHIHIDV